ncbi:MAG: hypothetical protein C5B50_27085 [Verrucomicrobia bacterium]|nr:MAG: hypothetical protein C5B50_27085 [Verrucomicrobiota bacterium]
MWWHIGEAAQEVGKSTDRLQDLILKYQKPLRIYLLGQFKGNPEVTNNADDLLQEFAHHKILAEGFLSKADPGKGRFRNFLKISLKRFVISQLRKEPPTGVSLEELEDEGKELAAPEEEKDSFDVAFTQGVLSETLGRMESECKGPTRPQPHTGLIWDLFSARVLDPLFRKAAPPPYEELVKRFNLKSVSEGTNMLLTAKRIFKRHLKDVIAEYEQGDQEVESELALVTQYVFRRPHHR